ncbi:hypothetical protein FEM48_Zijuj02G0125200 [Ziziphus jujuba var. spinosa]|uniref:C3H1-type domain-containing protein n=1 Tax=Ziziphus jujuba var. spinosa TaxID=714518 RepID=A0A978VVR4_ZIZJJ|nr:hypothetical protein FEM48_Zijuj02G0125200 [Ziziphus jujuba var. spinosa]
MPLGKYYCDYCDKYFQDTPSARKRHLQDPHQPYAESFGKGVCNRFVNTGFCQYGDSCRYVHPMNRMQNLNPQGISGFADSSQLPTFQGNQLFGGSSVPGDMVRDRMGMSWGNLPPSLKPPPEGGYPMFPFVDWG